jgi:hypothetical protein
VTRTLHNWLVALAVTWTVVGLLLILHVAIADGLILKAGSLLNGDG